jgi:predicted nucleotidyltransferase
MDVDGRSISVVNINDSLRIERPDAWLESAGSILRDDSQNVAVKVALVFELRRQISTDPRPRWLLRRLLRSTIAPPIRTVCAVALGAGGETRDARLLLRMLATKNDVEVRAACAASLGAAAALDSSIRNRLLELVNSSAPTELRAGAVWGLAKAARTDAPTTTRLLQLAQQSDTAAELRSACAFALEGRIDESAEVTDAFVSWIDGPSDSRLRRVAAQALADAMSDEKLPWDHDVAAKVEQTLMDLRDPCPHALRSLRALAAARERHRGLRLANVLREALKPVAGRIRLAFVFGSVARKRQSAESDLDLLIIGEVKLKDISTPLRQAETTLGRRINPALYTEGSFRERYQSGDPFLIDVCRREKIAVSPEGAAAAGKDLDDELRSMGAERLASA